MHPPVKADDACPFAMAVADALSIVGHLAGIMTCVVGKRPFWTAFVVYFRFPLHVSSRIKLAEFEPGPGISSKPTNRPIHDVTGNALDAINKIDVLFPIQWTIIHL